MKIGVIGSGNMGAALGKKWSEHNHQVKFSFSTDAENLKNWVASTTKLVLVA